MSEYLSGDGESEQARLADLHAEVAEMTRRALRQCAFDGHGTIVDIGCGTGSLALEMAREHPGARVVGVDISEQFIARAIAAAARSDVSNVSFRVGSAHALPLEMGECSLVIGRFILQHVEPLAAVAEFRRVLAPQGKVLSIETDWAGQLVYPLPDELDQLRALVVRKLAAAGADVHIGRKVPALLEQSGLSVQHVSAAADIYYGDPEHTRRKLGARVDILRRLLARDGVEQGERQRLEHALAALAQAPRLLLSEYRVITIASSRREDGTP